MVRKLKNVELNRLSVDEFKQKDKNPLIIVLDNIRSMHNVGSIFRTGDSLLVEGIYLCGITGQPPHKEIRKTALGADESVHWEYFTETVEAVDKLKQEGYILLGLEQAENSIDIRDYILDNTKKYALILGNEVEGVDADVLKHCDAILEIPQYGTKHSFNVSVSAGIAMWELLN